MAGAGSRSLHRLQRTASESSKPPPAQPDRPQPGPGHKPCSRRQQLLGLLAVPAGLTLGAPARAASSDLLEGTQNWASIGLQSYALWAQTLVDRISNDDQTGLTAAVTMPDGHVARNKRFGSISVPGLSSFSFVHGTLVGGLLILLLAADKLSPGQQQGSSQQQQQSTPLQPVQPSLAEQPGASPLNPEVEASLRRLLAQPDVATTFHDPAVQAALAEVRRDVRAITAYKNDAAVMQAFEKLLEIEDILERL